jgi:hypothetical protein
LMGLGNCDEQKRSGSVVGDTLHLSKQCDGEA